MEDFRRRETDILAIAVKGVLNINQDHGWRLEVSLQGECGACFTKGLVSNICMHVRCLDLSRCGALGEYRQVREVRADALEFRSSWIV